MRPYPDASAVSNSQDTHFELALAMAHTRQARRQPARSEWQKISDPEACVHALLVRSGPGKVRRCGSMCCIALLLIHVLVPSLGTSDWLVSRPCRRRAARGPKQAIEVHACNLPAVVLKPRRGLRPTRRRSARVRQHCSGDT